MNKRDAKSALKGLVTKVGALVADWGHESVRHDHAVEAIKLRLGIVFAESAPILATLEIGVSDWMSETFNDSDARESYGLPKASPPTLYRWLNSGTVALVLGDDLHPSQGVTSLARLYKILKGAKTPEDRETAEDLVRSAYRAACESAGNDSDGNPVAPSKAQVAEQADKVAPEGTRGPKVDESDDSDSDDSDETPAEQASSETRTVEINPETLATVAGNVSSFVTKTSKDQGIDPSVVKAIMGWSAMTCSEYGADYVIAALSAK